MSNTQAKETTNIILAATTKVVSCPMPDEAIWDAHPKVYLEANAQGEYCCPYCGKRYIISA